MPADLPYWIREDATFLSTSLGWTSQILRRIEVRDASRSYLRLVRVRDAVRLGDDAREGHVLDDLDALDLAHLRGGASALVLDLSNEGPSFSSGLFDALHRRLNEMAIPWERVALVQQNLDLEPDYRRHYNDGRLTFIISDFYVKSVGVAFSERHNNLTGTQPFRDVSYAPVQATTPGPVYLSLNGALRWHRILLFRYLSRAGLLDDGLVSFMGAGPENPKKEWMDFRNPPAAVKAAMPDDMADIEDWIPRRVIRFDGQSAIGNDLADTYLPDAYAQTCFSVVTETDFFDGNVRRVTEKAMKAACMGHPFLLLGPPGSLLILQRYGFRTFPEVFDESYDDIEDPAARFTDVCGRIARNVAAVKADRPGWMREIADAAHHNYAHGRTGFLDTYEAMVERRIFEQLSELLGSPIP